jgi:hypothetical protein
MSTQNSPSPVSSDAPDGAHQRTSGGKDPLERLRERVERAAREIERLRAENAELAGRVNDLAGDELFAPAKPVQPTLPGIEGDPAALRDRIQGFIDALDRVLADRTSGSSSPPSDPAG